MFVADKSDTVNKFKKLLHMLDTAESDMQGEVSNFRAYLSIFLLHLEC